VVYAKLNESDRELQRMLTQNAACLQTSRLKKTPWAAAISTKVCIHLNQSLHQHLLLLAFLHYSVHGTGGLCLSCLVLQRDLVPRRNVADFEAMMLPEAEVMPAPTPYDVIKGI
jgi:hypothetical protein